MKKITILILLSLSNLIFAQTPTFEWAKTPGGKPTFSAIDISGNIYTTGEFSGTVDFDPSTTVFNLTSSGSNKDAFVSKFDALGNFLWAFAIGGVLNDFTSTINVDSNGNVIIGGKFMNTVDFDPSTAIFNLTTDGITQNNSFILKIAPNMQFIWAKHFTGFENELTCLQIDASNNIISTGIFRYIVDFDPNSGVINMNAPSTTNQAFYISKLNSNGDFVWAKKYSDESAGSEKIYDFKLDTQGNMYTIGTINGAADFDPNSSNTLVTLTQAEVFVQKLDVNANLLFIKKFGTPGSSFITPKNLLIDSSNNIIIGGDFKFPTDFDPSTAVYNLDPGTMLISEVFILKLSNIGNFDWVKTPTKFVYQGSGTPVPGAAFNGVITLYNNEIYQTGTFQATVNFGSLSITSNNNGNTTPDFYNNIYLAKLNNSGDYQWITNFTGDVTAIQLQQINIHNSGNIIIQGSVKSGSTVDFDPSSNVANILGTLDTRYIVKYNQPNLSFIKSIFQNDNLKLIPNPTSGNFNITIEENLIGAKVAIFNFLGQNIKQFSLDALTTNQTLEAGIYILEIEKDGNKTTRKLVVQ